MGSPKESRMVGGRLALSILILSSVFAVTNLTNNSYSETQEQDSLTNIQFNPSSITADTKEAGEVVAASGANRFVVWQDDTPGNFDILFRRSTDDGSTWKATVNLSKNPGRSIIPQIAVSGSNVYVLWTQYNPAETSVDIFFSRSTDNGATWSSKVNFSANGKVDSGSIHASGANVYVTWADNTPGNFDIMLRRSTDNGATWKPKVNLSNNPESSGGQLMAFSGSNVYIVWSDGSFGHKDIMLRRSTDNGATWKPKVNLSNDAKDSGFPAIAVSGSTVYVSWMQQVGSCDFSCPHDIIFRRSTDNGATWKSKTNLSNSGTVDSGPLVAASGSSVYVGWVAFVDSVDSNAPLLRKSANSGASFGTAKILDGFIDESYSFDLDVSGTRVYFTVTSFDTATTCGTLQDITLNKSTDSGSTFTSKNLAHGYIGPASVESTGSSVYVVYSQAEEIDCAVEGPYDVYLLKSTNSGASFVKKNLSNNNGESFTGGFAL